MTYRTPFVAGNYYPDQQAPLKSNLRLMLRDKDQNSAEPKPQTKPQATAKAITKPKAIVVPHAGFTHSGEIAAHAYAAITPFADEYKQVVVLGPSHRYPVQGCVVPSHDGFITPLGKIKVDQAQCLSFIESGLAENLDAVHQQEYSIEVQLPFLQHCLTQFTLLPIIVGKCQAQKLTDLLNNLGNLDDTLFVISANLSHFNAKSKAEQIDQKTINQLTDLSGQITTEQSCAANLLNGFSHFARSKNAQCKLLHYDNACDGHQVNQEVVGYASLAYWF